MRCARVAVLGVAAVLAGCSWFDADYQKALAAESGQPVVGAWVGRWQSNQGHGGGELRAIITPDAGTTGVAATQAYTGRFKAKWGWFTSEYTAKVTARTDMRKMSTAAVTVEADLGFMAGGKYTMTGESTPTDFKASYRSSGDEGSIDMGREAPAEKK